MVLKQKHDGKTDTSFMLTFANEEYKYIKDYGFIHFVDIKETEQFFYLLKEFVEKESDNSRATLTLSIDPRFKDIKAHVYVSKSTISQVPYVRIESKKKYKYLSDKDINNAYNNIIQFKQSKLKTN
jgi:alanine-alpha-ketoisovalerate/valine-pyruvate aminotransferase